MPRELNQKGGDAVVDGKEIKLCDSCDKCATAVRVGDEIHLKDDFGGKVRLTLEELQKLKKLSFRKK